LCGALALKAFLPPQTVGFFKPMDGEGSFYILYENLIRVAR